jgi:hypothetical protein
VVSNPVPVTLSLFGAQIPLQTPAVFFTGAATMLVTIVALWLLRVGFRRELARRKELRSLKKAAKNDATGTAPKPAGGQSGAQPARPAVDSASAVPQRPTTPAPASPAGSGARPSTSADREALLAEVENATRDEPPAR